ncbi:hypothetical protein NL676_036525 [Syzygium grande]|nr:hypothetical protein NL676_036525 [Syzygium grande]
MSGGTPTAFLAALWPSRNCRIISALSAEASTAVVEVAAMTKKHTSEMAKRIMVREFVRKYEDISPPRSDVGLNRELNVE